MQKTGTDLYLAEHIVSWLGQLGVKAVLFGFMLLTVLLTIPMTNAAAALVVLPIAIATANTLGKPSHVWHCCNNFGLNFGCCAF